MDPFSVFALTIPLACVAIAVGSFGQQWLKLKEKQLELLSRDTAEKAARYAAQTERLEQRMQTVERIITEGRSDLAQQIEDLRDAPLN